MFFLYVDVFAWTNEKVSSTRAEEVKKSCRMSERLYKIAET